MKNQPLLILTLVCVVGSAASIGLAFVPPTEMVTLATRITNLQF